MNERTTLTINEIAEKAADLLLGDEPFIVIEDEPAAIEKPSKTDVIAAAILRKLELPADTPTDSVILVSEKPPSIIRVHPQRTASGRLVA